MYELSLFYFYVTSRNTWLMRLCVAASSINVLYFYQLQMRFTFEIFTDSHWMPTDYFDQHYIGFCNRSCKYFSSLFLHAPGGATQMARGGIRLIHGLTKSTLITYYSGMKKDPKYAFLHGIFLICLSCSFQNLSIWPKTHPFFQFCTFLHP